MPTLRLMVNSEDLSAAGSRLALDQAAAILRGGGTVALPTETVYGLGANALDASAVAKIFAAKERPGWDPLIVHVADEAMLAEVTGEIPERARRLIDAFWPGPLTLLLPRSAAISDAVTAGRQLVGVRMPAHPVALELIRLAGVPVAAPSANRFGRTSPTTAGHVLEDLDGRIDAVVDSGPTAFGVESTVLDPNASPMIVYRRGAITLEQIRGVAGDAELFVEPGVGLLATTDEVRIGLPSPGVGLRHYAPRARLMLIPSESGGQDMEPRLAQELLKYPGERVGVMWPGQREKFALDGFASVYLWGDWADPEELARRLFAGLRELDAQGCDVILCPVPVDEGIGSAIRDRLKKAAWRP